MSRIADACGCFPTGRHYPGVAHLLRAVIRGVAEEFAVDTPWAELPVALLDVETTGRDASKDRVIEVGIAVGRGGAIVARYDWLINPGVAISEESRAVHHISDEDVKDSPRFEAVAHEIRMALEGTVPAAYNAAFDRAFLVNEFARTAGTPEKVPPALRRDVDWIDPLVWAREIQRAEKSKALAEVATRLGVKLERAHRASDDAEAALLVLFALAEDSRVPRGYGALVQEQRRLALLQQDERRFWKTN